MSLRSKTMKEISNRTEVVLRVIGKVTEVSETGKSFKIQQVSINDLPQHYRDRLGQMHLCRQREDTTEYKFENKPWTMLICAGDKEREMDSFKNVMGMGPDHIFEFFIRPKYSMFRSGVFLDGWFVDAWLVHS